MNHLHIKTKEANFNSDMDLSSAYDNHVTIETNRKVSDHTNHYTRILVDKDQAVQVIAHLQKQFGL